MHVQGIQKKIKLYKKGIQRGDIHSLLVSQGHTGTCKQKGLSRSIRNPGGRPIRTVEDVLKSFCKRFEHCLQVCGQGCELCVLKSLQKSAPSDRHSRTAFQPMRNELVHRFLAVFVAVVLNDLDFAICELQLNGQVVPPRSHAHSHLHCLSTAAPEDVQLAGQRL